ncbi:MAG: hypothetical protein N3B14_06535 [Thermoleophilia bacterium]|nr:hypothetical protein [Thermoleophilia bacterium]
MAKLPFGVSKALEVWRHVSQTTVRPTNLILAGNPRLVEAARERFAAGGVVPAEWRVSADRLANSELPAEDLILLLVTPEEEEAYSVAVAARRPAGGAIIAVDEGARATGRASSIGLRCRRLSFSDSEWGWQRLYEICVETAGERAVSLAKRYPVLRDSAARRVIAKGALQGGAVGIASALRGTQAPALAAVQLNVVLTLAALHGHKLDQERVPEVVLVVAAGFGTGRVARYLERRVPKAAWLVRVVAATLGTLAVGLAALCYYRKGAPWSTTRLISFVASLRR